MEKFFGTIVVNSTDVTVPVLLRSKVNGTELTGLGVDDVDVSYWRQNEIPISIPLFSLPSMQYGHVNGGWREVNATSHPGEYRLDLPDEVAKPGSDWFILSVVTPNGLGFHERYNLETRNILKEYTNDLSVGNISYISLAGADVYFLGKFDSKTWDQATTDSKSRALIEATRLIDRLHFKGLKVDSTQVLEFPRKYLDPQTKEVSYQQSTIPDDIKKACAEIAYSILQGINIEQEIKKLNVTSNTFGNVKTTYNENMAHEHLRSGIPSATAWLYLRPYLVDISNIKLLRVS